VYYGQFLDDKLIEEYFESGYIGGCIDVGATNGVDINNTKYFEDNGWYCLCIEPNPNSYEALKNNRKNTLNFAISNSNKDLVDFTVVNLNNNSNESEGAISSLILDDKLYQQHIDMGFNLTQKDIKVSTRTLDYCIEHYFNYDKIDFLDIDTEGTELDVLKGFDINRWQPKLIVVENNFNEIFVEKYLNQFNYKKDKRVGVNDYFIKNEKRKFLIGPKLGDFFHSLYVVKCLSENFKSDVYIKENIDEKFTNGLENTYTDIYSVVKSQPYIDNFLLYNENVDCELISSKHCNFLYKCNWYEIYQNLFNITNEYEEPWLYKIFENNEYENKVIVNFSTIRYDDVYDDLLQDIIKNNDCLFISTNEEEYNKFKFKNLLSFKKCDSFSELYSIIENCKFFVGNQSMILSIAHGLFKPHIGFLFNVDAIHYKDNFNENYFWFDDQKNISKNFNEIINFIKLVIKIEPTVVDISNNIDFNIRCDILLNKIYIGCNSKIDAVILIYEFLINENKKILRYSTITSFNNTIYWYSMNSKKLKDLQYIKIEIRNNETLLKEEIIEIK